MSLSNSDEDAIIERLCQHLSQRDHVLVGPGDDCAVVKTQDGSLQLLKTDCVVENVHFLPEEEGERVGWKATARVVSDIAAMGGQPHSMLVTLVLRPDTQMSWVDALYRGMQRCADAYAFSIVGGETSSAPPHSPNMISIAGTGSVTAEHLVLRSTAQAGDSILVTGALGGSIQGKHLDFTPRLAEAQWLCQHAKPSAMMDLSDGLGKDLPRLAKSSQLGFQLELEALPRNPQCSSQQALYDGEDYELLFTLKPEALDSVLASWPKHFAPLSVLGKMLADPDTTTQLDGGWDHFK